MITTLVLVALGVTARCNPCAENAVEASIDFAATIVAAEAVEVTTSDLGDGITLVEVAHNGARVQRFMVYDPASSRVRVVARAGELSITGGPTMLAFRLGGEALARH